MNQAEFNNAMIRFMSKAGMLNSVVDLLSEESLRLLKEIQTCPMWRPFKFVRLCNQHKEVHKVWGSVLKLYDDLNREGVK